MTSHKGAAYAFRSEVLLAFHEAGFLGARKAPEARDGHRELRGDVLGVDGVTIAVRNQRDIALAEAADEVQREAASEGNDIFVSIQARRSANVDNVLNAFCTMPLHVLLTLLRGRPARVS